MQFHDPLNANLIESKATYAEKINSGFFEKYFSGEIILDIGYKGSNTNADPILPKAIGIDIDYPGYDGKILPFSTGSVDTVYTSHCLEHIADYSGAILEWFRVLKIGGYLIIIVPHMYLYERRQFLPSKWNLDHKRFYTPARLIREVEETISVEKYRVVSLKDNWNENYNYSGNIEEHAHGPYEIELVLVKIN